MTERISFPENLLPLAVIKDSFKIYFHEMVELLPVKRISEELEQNGFRQPENQFPLARIKIKKMDRKNQFTLGRKKL